MSLDEQTRFYILLAYYFLIFLIPTTNPHPSKSVNRRLLRVIRFDLHRSTVIESNRANMLSSRVDLVAWTR